MTPQVLDLVSIDAVSSQTLDRQRSHKELLALENKIVADTVADTKPERLLDALSS